MLNVLYFVSSFAFLFAFVFICRFGGIQSDVTVVSHANQLCNLTGLFFTLLWDIKPSSIPTTQS